MSGKKGKAKSGIKKIILKDNKQEILKLNIFSKGKMKFRIRKE
jgi:hypothetical protein